MKLIITPSPKKLLPIIVVSLLLAVLCFSVEDIFNKITFGTQIIRLYETVFFIMLAGYFALQLIPGFAKLIIAAEGYREIWFFRQRIQVQWSEINSSKSSQQKTADTLYLNHIDEQLLSRKLALKGIYPPAMSALFEKFMAQVKDSESNTPVTTGQQYYFSLSQIRKSLLLIFSVLLLAFNSFYLSNEKVNYDFVEQIKVWQQEGKNSEQLFDALKIYGMAWKKELKRFDRRLYFQVLEIESSRIEELMLKYFQENNQPSDAVLKLYKESLTDCRKRFLFLDETAYMQCLDKI